MAVIKFIAHKIRISSWPPSEWKLNSKDHVVFNKFLSSDRALLPQWGKSASARASVSLAPVLGARALETGRTICHTLLQWILPQWVLLQWGIVWHHLKTPAWKTVFDLLLGGWNYGSDLLLLTTLIVQSTHNLARWNLGMASLKEIFASEERKRIVILEILINYIHTRYETLGIRACKL